MQTASLFSYNLPSIPGKSIRLKITSQPKSGFSSKVPRHSQNYSKLNNSFVSEYSNLQPKRAMSQSTHSTTNTSEVSSKGFMRKKQEPQYWYIIPQHKGILVNLYEDQMKDTKREVVNINAALRKRDNISRRLYLKFIKEKNEQKSYYEEILKDEYHKIWQDESKRRSQAKVKPSPCFMTVPRRKEQQPVINQIQQQDYNEYQIGQSVLLPQQIDDQESERFDPQQLMIQQPKPLVSLKHQTQKMLQKIGYKHNQKSNPQKRLQQEHIPNHMFIKDDRDRFGNQIFPIVPKLNVPGPGSYDEKNTMQNKAKKAKLLQQQRKILKQWFND